MICIDLPGHFPGFHFRRQNYFPIINFSWHPSLEHNKVLCSKYHSSSSWPVWNCAASTEFGSRGCWWLQQEADVGLWWCPAGTSHPACPAGPPGHHCHHCQRGHLQQGHSCTGIPCPSELCGLLLRGTFQAFVSNTWGEYESKWLNDNLLQVSPGFSRGLGSWRELIYTWCICPFHMHRFSFGDYFRVWPNDDMPCMGNTGNT